MHQNLLLADRVPHTQPLHSLTFLSRNWAQVGNQPANRLELRDFVIVLFPTHFVSLIWLHWACPCTCVYNNITIVHRFIDVHSIHQTSSNIPLRHTETTLKKSNVVWRWHPHWGSCWPHELGQRRAPRSRFDPKPWWQTVTHHNTTEYNYAAILV